MKNSESLVQITDNLLKEKIQRLLAIKEKIKHVDTKVKNQLLENEKTQYFITYLRDFYTKQKDMLDVFNDQKTVLSTEYGRLAEEIAVLQYDDDLQQTKHQLNNENQVNKRKHNEMKKTEDDVIRTKVDEENTILNSLVEKTVEESDNPQTSLDNSIDSIISTVLPPPCKRKRNITRTFKVIKPVSEGENENMNKNSNNESTISSQISNNDSHTILADVNSNIITEKNKSKRDNEAPASSLCNDKNKHISIEQKNMNMPISNCTAVTNNNSHTNTEVSNKANQQIKVFKLKEFNASLEKRKFVDYQNKIYIKLQPALLKLVYQAEIHTRVTDIIANKNGVFCSGTNGLVMNLFQDKCTKYHGHYKDVKHIYLYNDSLISICNDYILIHKINFPMRNKELHTFVTPMEACCMHKSTIYVALANYDLLIIDVGRAETNYRKEFFRNHVTAMSVVRCSSKNYMIVSQEDEEVICIDFEAKHVLSKSLGRTKGVVNIMINDSNVIICASLQNIYIIAKVNWTMRLLREMTHRICCMTMAVNYLVVVDAHKHLHRYVIKQNSISNGSSIESVEPFPDKPITALNYFIQSKRLYITSGNCIYNV